MELQTVVENRERLDAAPDMKPAAVLYAAPHGPQSLTALLRADALARARGERLIVLRVVPRVGSGDPLFPRQVPLRAAHLLRLEAAVGKLTARWCRRHLCTPPDPDDIQVRRGTLDQVVRDVCGEHDVSLIVLARSEGMEGAGVEALALDTLRPVLVAEAQGPSDLVIAGSSLEDRNDPVLRFTGDLCARLKAPGLFLHNVSPFLMSVPFSAAATAPTLVHLPALVTDRARLLKAAARRIDSCAATELRHELDPASALVDLANKRGADLVVVGARPRPWWRLLERSVAAAVVDRACASVLVLPLVTPQAWLPRAWG